MTTNEQAPHQTVAGSWPVLLDVVGHVAHIQLNRPQAANGLDNDLLKALHEVLMTVHGDPQVRAVLLSGKGANFCAGGDVHLFASKGEALPDYLRQATSYLYVVMSALIHLNAPVVAAVQGFAAGGGGMGLVCASDFVVAAASSKYLAGATRVGMAPDAGLSVTLPALVGMRKAMEMLMTNPTVTAQEALAMGLVTRVVADAALLDEAMTLAQELARQAPQAMVATKRLLWSGLGLGVDAAMPEESRTVAALSATADVREGLAAVIERRAPKFTGR